MKNNKQQKSTGMQFSNEPHSGAFVWMDRTHGCTHPLLIRPDIYLNVFYVVNGRINDSIFHNKITLCEC